MCVAHPGTLACGRTRIVFLSLFTKHRAHLTVLSRVAGQQGPRICLSSHTDTHTHIDTHIHTHMNTHTLMCTGARAHTQIPCVVKAGPELLILPLFLPSAGIAGVYQPSKAAVLLTDLHLTSRVSRHLSESCPFPLW